MNNKHTKDSDSRQALARYDSAMIPPFKEASVKDSHSRLGRISIRPYDNF
jgi:hypothetical protein